ncbi:DUF397 domain-containing protein [Amycolatopsis anabasis]|uniref:DUF397 domain-containing protein n=1 Tax=Amycolatopsis anabasis TaxID=1840409 RepID=UPI00131D9D7D|nr:DUF397 domain-containing protein [Amycolatopsis anabasis]
MTAHPRWRTSSYTGENGDCIEVALGVRRTQVRDTKDRGGGSLNLSSQSWAAFVAAIKTS